MSHTAGSPSPLAGAKGEPGGAASEACADASAAKLGCRATLPPCSTAGPLRVYQIQLGHTPHASILASLLRPDAWAVKCKIRRPSPLLSHHHALSQVWTSQLRRRLLLRPDADPQSGNSPPAAPGGSLAGVTPRRATLRVRGPGHLVAVRSEKFDDYLARWQ